MKSFSTIKEAKNLKKEARTSSKTKNLFFWPKYQLVLFSALSPFKFLLRSKNKRLSCDIKFYFKPEQFA